VHGDPERIAVAAEVEAGLRLEHHRERARERWKRSRLEELAAERAHRELDTVRSGSLRRVRPAGEHPDVGGHAAAVGLLAHVHAELGSAANELAGHRRRLGDTVLTAHDSSEDVVHRDPRREPLDLLRGEPLDGDTKALLERPPLLELRHPLRGRGEKEVPDLLEEAGAELLEEADAVTR
jgi:hypothetical protein